MEIKTFGELTSGEKFTMSNNLFDIRYMKLNDVYHCSYSFYNAVDISGELVEININTKVFIID